MISLQRNDRLRVVRRRALIVLAGALLSMAIAWFAPPTPARAQNQNPMGVSLECWTGAAYVPCGGGGYNVSPPFVPKVQNAGYTSGQSLGGLQTIPFFRTSISAHGIFDNFQIASVGGATTPMTFYIFEAVPSAATTCADRQSFVLGAADISKLGMVPFVLTPAVIGAGTTVTFAQQTQVISLQNIDSPNTVNLYVCIVAGGSVTPATTTDLEASIQGAVD